MKKQIAVFLMSTSLILPIGAVASAEQVSPSSSPDIIPNEVISTSRDVSPTATDGNNINWDFMRVSDFVKSTPLPIHRSGTVTVHFVQNSNNSSYPAVVTYQFVSQDGVKRSTAIQRTGNFTDTAGTITFTNVPKGTEDNPIYLHIINNTGHNIQIWGNGYTT
ncbi:hypothetical protein AV545_04530 [Paenibacillus jamilae]|uniref:hypothetical protein n=1 Tax=Paenibacillus jamilae TaxID=114136 RepID=UPI0007ABCC27|nr:hypothetical protein [Paenibacillus jamilae]KZE65196.1 hypothetical protein AV545_04530 [Paenibacillus jamilae]